MKKILITSALPYVNNVPHLGNIIGCVLSADVFARYCKSRGWNTRYICGSDEHGTTTEAKALEEGLTPQQVCDKYYKIHKDIYEWFGIKFDAFGKTSTETHKKITQEIFLKLKENDYIIEDFLEELYCEKCKKSLADRFVEGTCPFCEFEGARGDQCDKCGKLINAIELKNPKCKICNEAPTKKSTKHLFLDLVKLQPELEKWIAKQSKDGFWSENTITYTNAWLKEGLKKRCISRQLKWGIPIPLKGFENMVFYVWFDAPIGYISITAHKFNDWKDWWKNPEHVNLYQFMGKDNVPFHTIIFPGSLMGTKEKYTMLYHINTTEYLNYEDGKFSKSRNVGVFGDDAMQLGIPADAFRYYLLVNRPERADTVFSWDDFQDKQNHELIGNLGNLVNRTVVFLNKYYDSIIPEPDLGKEEKDFVNLIRESKDKITALLDKVKLKESIKELMALCSHGNKFFQDAQPWKNIKENKKKADNAMYVLANLVKDIAILCEPYLPFSSEKIFNQLNIDAKQWDDVGVLSVENGHKIGSAEVLFSKLVEEDKKKLKEKFSGAGKKKQAESDECTDENTKADEKKGFDLLNLKVALVKEVEDHPKADKLVIIKLDLGKEQRQIVAGIKEFYSKEVLKGKKIIVVTNLQPAELRGVKSNGMLLACMQGDKLGLVTAKKAEPGTQVLVDGSKPNDDIISIDDFKTIKLRAKDGKAFGDDKVMKAGEEELFVEKDVSGKIK
ncbi:MAG: methionine--tRNA ligase [Nanoarchaeota archaeon]|nr:methionine--tRNA ligase [Nanoarchaeota archaeon]MBU1322037.1 methionine--tRNA ligase [Nanoarchaeota archaeon]MBU1597229.1 methionine--tRNA ligase [Nanoarchaeota archaeon]MBU2440726.1 methionine--tRNA ligase [Nanoarchaeota archaeon]